MKEIEKKYLLQEMPAGLSVGKRIRQGYIFAEDFEMRLRQKETAYYLTIKGDGTLTRDEWEEEIPKWVFETLWPKTEGKRVEKIRYTVDLCENILEIDEYCGQLAGLFTLEIEFKTETDAKCFGLPQWLNIVGDITADKRYKNKNLAIKGAPK